jgi:hypothetical protein
MKLSTHELLGEEIARLRHSLRAICELLAAEYGRNTVPVRKFTKALFSIEDARCVLDDYVCRENKDPRLPNHIVCGALYSAEQRVPDLKRVADALAQEASRG